MVPRVLGVSTFGLIPIALAISSTQNSVHFGSLQFWSSSSFLILSAYSQCTNSRTLLPKAALTSILYSVITVLAFSLRKYICFCLSFLSYSMNRIQKIFPLFKT
jgi:hypothetical protein